MEPFLGQVSMFSFNFAPRGWALCDGQSLPINQNQALFSLLGTTFGGNGQTTFNLPDLRGRVPLHSDHSGGGIVLGQRAGEEIHTLTLQELAGHTHPVNANSNAPNTGVLTNNTWAAQTGNAYGTSPNAQMKTGAVVSSGGNQPHSNLQPFLTINFCIALQGIFPSPT